MRKKYVANINHIGLRSDRVAKVSGGGFPSEFSSPGSDKTNTSGGPAPISTALVSINQTKPNRNSKKSANRQSAPLVAQLIATYMELPQTRTRRRTSSRSADLAYISGKMERTAEITGTRLAKKV